MAAEQEMANSGPDPAQPPTMRQLTRVAITKGLPFVAFGFFDNVIMITAGEQIDMLFGAKLGLSAMMAAGLGNTIADVVGINISHSIEVGGQGWRGCGVSSRFHVGWKVSAAAWGGWHLAAGAVCCCQLGVHVRRPPYAPRA